MSLLEEESIGGDDDDEEEGDDAVSPEAKFKKMLRSLERAHDSERDMNKKQFEQCEFRLNGCPSHAVVFNERCHSICYDATHIS